MEIVEKISQSARNSIEAPTRDGNRGKRDGSREEQAVQEAAENRGEGAPRDEAVEFLGGAEEADSRVKTGEESGEEEKKRQNGREEVDGRFEMEKREGNRVGLRVSALKQGKNRDDAMEKWSFEKATMRFRRSFWFCLHQASQKGKLEVRNHRVLLRERRPRDPQEQFRLCLRGVSSVRPGGRAKAAGKTANTGPRAAARRRRT